MQKAFIPKNPAVVFLILRFYVKYRKTETL